MSFLPPALNFRFFLLSEANSHLQSRLPAGEVRARVKSSELPLSTATDFGDCTRSLGWFFISLGDKHSLSSSEATQVPIGRHQHTRPIGLLLLASFVVRLLVSHHEQFVVIAHPMNRPVRDEELFMEEALAAIRRAITDEQAGQTLVDGATKAPNEASRSAGREAMVPSAELALRTAGIFAKFPAHPSSRAGTRRL